MGQGCRGDAVGRRWHVSVRLAGSGGRGRPAPGTPPRPWHGPSSLTGVRMPAYAQPPLEKIVRASDLSVVMIVAVSSGLLSCEPVSQSQGEPPPGSAYEGQAFTFHQAREDIYQAVGTGALAVGSNAAVIVNEEDVLLVDSHISPAAGWALLEELRTITTKPVRYVVNTHFHFDHLHGNQIFPPNVEIIGHEFTREMVVTGQSRSGRAYDAFIGTLPDQIRALEEQIQQATDDDSARAVMEERLVIQRNYLEATNAVVPTPPTVTLSDRMTLFRGDREIQLFFFGRGHTGGDVVVYLPAERVLITGDLLTGGLPYMGDGFLTDWVATLEEMKSLDFDTIVPGHGRTFGDRAKIDHLQAYLQDLWAKVVRMRDNGVSAEQAAAQIDMRNHATNYPEITDVGVNPHAVLRVYEILEGRS